jgi:AraC family transcriptional regulator
MPSYADTFARFVDLVTSNLDEPETRGEELAAQLYLSRSQLDRVVTAAAGEAPGRFRRRILLERAAYRLIARDVGVLDVAVEAGYASNEAFTRAFRRAYAGPVGTPPGNRRCSLPSGG